MTQLAINGLLVVTVLGAWLGSAGFARLRSPLDRIHCVAFVNVVSGTALAAAAFCSDGVSARACKILLIAGVSLLTGATTAHATGRALLRRGSAEPDVGERG